MMLNNVLTTEEINQLMIKVKGDIVWLEELYDQGVLRVFNSDDELFDWFNEDGQDCEYFLDQPLDGFLDKIKLYGNNSRTVLQALRKIIIGECDYIYSVGSGAKFIMIL